MDPLLQCFKILTVLWKTLYPWFESWSQIKALTFSLGQFSFSCFSGSFTGAVCIHLEAFYLCRLPHQQKHLSAAPLTSETASFSLASISLGTNLFFICSVIFKSVTLLTETVYLFSCIPKLFIIGFHILRDNLLSCFLISGSNIFKDNFFIICCLIFRIGLSSAPLYSQTVFITGLHTLRGNFFIICSLIFRIVILISFRNFRN